MLFGQMNEQKKNENIGYWLVGTNVPRDKQTKTNRKTSILLLLLSFVVCRNNHVNIVVVVIFSGQSNQVENKSFFVCFYLFRFINHKHRYNQFMFVDLLSMITRNQTKRNEENILFQFKW